MQEESDRKQKWEEEKANANRKRKLPDANSLDDGVDNEIGDPSFTPSQKKKPKSQFVPILLPRKVLAGEHVTQMADRTGVSYRVQTGMVASVLQDAKSLDGSDLNMNEFNLSKETARQARKINREHQEEKFNETFVPPKHTAFHWDEKFCKKVLLYNFTVNI